MRPLPYNVASCPPRPAATRGCRTTANLALVPHWVGNRAPSFAIPAAGTDPISTLPWPLIEAPASEMRDVAQALASARIDQALVLALIQGGLGGTDLATWLAEPLMERLQRADPLPAAWTALVLQALRDPREVWEPAFLPERAHLRTHLLDRPNTLLRARYLQLLRPWQVSLHAWHQRVDGCPAAATLEWPALRALRGDPPGAQRHASLQELTQRWRDWCGPAVPDGILARCTARANALNRHERGVWEPLVAVDVLREHLQGTAALAALPGRLQLRCAPTVPADPQTLAASVLHLAFQARHDPAAVLPYRPSDTPSPRMAMAVCGLLAGQYAHDTLFRRVPTRLLPAADPRPGIRDVASQAPQAIAAAPYPPWPGTRSGALTLTGSVPAPSSASGPGVAAEAANPPFGQRRGGGGMRPAEAMRTVADRFTPEVCARWLDVSGSTAADFNAALHQLLRDAQVPATERVAGDAAVEALFEEGDAMLSASLQRADVPLLARALLKRTSQSTRIYLVALALSRLYARIQPRVPDDAAMSEAAQWMRSVHAYFHAQVTDPAVRQNVHVGDAAAWQHRPASTALPATTATPTPVAPWDPGMNASALAARVRGVLPGNATALPAVLAHVLGRSTFPDPMDLEQAVGHLYAGNATRTLIARAMSLPDTAVDDTLNQWFFARLAEEPLDAGNRSAHLVQWQAQLRLRAPGQRLRGDWIAQLTPARAAALFRRDDAGGLQRVLEQALPANGDTARAWAERLRSVQRLGAWLESGTGQRRLARLLGRQNAADNEVPRFLFEEQGLPASDGLALLRHAVLHSLGNDTLDTLAPSLAQARQSPCPVLSLAVTLHERHPLLQGASCLSHAAVLLLPDAGTAPSTAPALAFPLPPLPANATLPPLELHTVLRDSGLGLLEQLDPALPAWHAWELMAQTHAFNQAARALSSATGSQADGQTLLARWMLDHGVGTQTVARLTNALDGTLAREQPMQTSRTAWLAELPALAWGTARALFWWLLVRQAGRPEWLVADLPEWLDHGRSLESLSLMHGAILLDAVAPGVTARWRYADIVRVPRQLAGASDEFAPDRPSPWLQALVRPALRHAEVHAAVVGQPPSASANASDVAAALDLLGRHQATLAQAAGQLARPAPQRMALAARQLEEAGVPARYWNQTVFAVPEEVQQAAGLVRNEGMESALAGVSWGLPLVVRAAEDAIAQDTLQQLLVGGVYELSGRPSISQLYEQAFALYRQQMTGALATMVTRSLDMLCTADRQLLRRSRVTPLRVPAGPRGAVLRCEGTVPVYFVVVPSAGVAARLAVGDRFDGQHWRSGLLHDPRSFASGHVADQSDPLELQFLDLTRCEAGSTLAPRNASSCDDAALVNAVAEWMYGDFFTRTRDAELSRLTGMEQLRQTEAAFADGLAAFAVPFYGCATNLLRGQYASAAVDCTVDALSMLVPAARFGRFLRSTTRMMVRGGEVTASALLRDSGAALLRLVQGVAEQSGLLMLRDLGRGIVRVGGRGRAWVLEQLPALQTRAGIPLRNARLDELHLRAATRAGASAAALDEIAPGFPLDRHLLDDTAEPAFSLERMCSRVRRQVNVGGCEGEAIDLFGHEPSPRYDTPGDVTWFAGMQVTSYEPLTREGRLFIFDGEYWRQTRADSGFSFARAPDHAAPAPRQHIRATLVGGERQLVRVELHNPYPDHLMRVSQGALIGRTREGRRAVITRVAPGRFYVAALDGDASAGTVLSLWPLEHQGFTAAQNDAVKTAWWGAFHYSQQCRLSGPALVDRFGSQLQRQLDQLDELGTLLDDVRSGSPYLFDNLPAQAVLSCAQSNCRYVQELRRQVGPQHWRAPRDSDHWIDAALRDLLNPVPPQDSLRVFHGLDATLESRFLTPRRGPAKTVAMVRLTLKNDPVPLVFHSTSGQRKGRSLLPIANLDRGNAPANWVVDGKEVLTPQARYVDAQPTVVSIQRGDVAAVAPNHSLHAEDLDGQLFNERNTRAYDAERNLYYRIQQYIARRRLDPAQVTDVEVFSSRRVCASCHISVGSLRAEFPGSRFTVIERDVAPAAAGLDNRPASAP
jgi:hypothetical protein